MTNVNEHRSAKREERAGTLALTFLSHRAEHPDAAAALADLRSLMEANMPKPSDTTKPGALALAYLDAQAHERGTMPMETRNKRIACLNDLRALIARAEQAERERDDLRYSLDFQTNLRRKADADVDSLGAEADAARSEARTARADVARLREALAGLLKAYAPRARETLAAEGDRVMHHAVIAAIRLIDAGGRRLS